MELADILLSVLDSFSLDF